MTRELGIAGIQMAPVAWDPVATQEKMAQRIEQVRDTFPWVDLILFPELMPSAVAPFAPGTPSDFESQVAEPIPGPTSKRFAALAARYRCWLVPGSLLEREGTNVYNTAVVFSPQGEMVARYRKLFPWRPYEQTVPGDCLCVFDVQGVAQMGLCICYDLWFPEVSRGLALRGAEVILHPSLTSTVDRPQEQILARATAIFNQAYLIDVNGLTPVGGGRSIFVDPNGRDLQTAGERESIITELLDLNLVTSVRHTGTLGLNCVLKQVRDQAPLIERLTAKTDMAWMESLGPLTMHRS
jgi:formamidase